METSFYFPSLIDTKRLFGFMSLDLNIAAPPILGGQRVALTGTLASMTHKRAQEIIRENGGDTTDRVSGQTTLLVVGEEGWPLDADGHPSVDFQKAETMRVGGTPIRIVTESDFLRMVGLSESEAAGRLYTPAMLTRLLDVPTGLIRRWERLGLLRPVKKVGRLPYFDFREVTRVRKLIELLESEVPRERLETSLKQLGGLAGFDDAVEQLDLVADGGRLLARDGYGLFQPTSGQRLFDFQSETVEADDDQPLLFPVPPRPKSEADWHDRGLELLDAGQTVEAIEAFRSAIRLNPSAPELHFTLGEALYQAGESAAALERYRVATEWDEEYVEAWTQIGCLHVERHESPAARVAFEQALTLFPDHADAHYHLAGVLEDLGEVPLAVEHLQAFLSYEPDGVWSDMARQRLETLE